MSHTDRRAFLFFCYVCFGFMAEGRSVAVAGTVLRGKTAALSFPSLESSVSTSTLSLTCVGVPMLMIILSSLIKYRCGLFFATDRMLGTENVDLALR